MDRKQLDMLLPMLFGLAVVVVVLFFEGALLPVVVIGGLLLGIYYSVFRSRMVREEGAGRQRERNRDRDRGV